MSQIPGHPIEKKKITQQLLEIHERRLQDERLYSGWKDMHWLWRKGQTSRITLPKQVQSWSDQKTIRQYHDECWRSAKESCTWRDYVIKWRHHHDFYGRSDGRSDATGQVYVRSHNSFYGYWKQWNLRYKRVCQKIEVAAHRIGQHDYLYI